MSAVEGRLGVLVLGPVQFSSYIVLYLLSSCNDAVFRNCCIRVLGWLSDLKCFCLYRNIVQCVAARWQLISIAPAVYQPPVPSSLSMSSPRPPNHALLAN